MRKYRTFMMLMAVLAASAFVLSGCQKTLSSLDENFTFSYGINDDGYWDGINASKLVELPVYEGIQIPADVHTVSDDDVQAKIDDLMKNYEQDVNVTGRPVEDGDTVNIDYVGTIDGVEFDGGNTMGNGTDVTIGVTNYIDDFLEQLIGHSPGETFDINVTFPDDYQEESLAGKDAVFKTTINHIVTKEIPDPTDDFINEAMSDSYGWTTYDEMKAGITSQLVNSAVESYIQQYLIDNTTVKKLPQILVEYEEYSMVQYYRDYANYYNMDLNDFLSTYVNVASAQELIDSNADTTEKTAKAYLIIQAIAEQEGITVTEDDVNSYFSQLMGSDDIANYQDKYGMPHMKMVTIQKKVLDFLMENSVLE